MIHWLHVSKFVWWPKCIRLREMLYKWGWVSISKSFLVNSSVILLVHHWNSLDVWCMCWILALSQWGVCLETFFWRQMYIKIIFVWATSDVWFEVTHLEIHLEIHLWRKIPSVALCDTDTDTDTDDTDTDTDRFAKTVTSASQSKLP